MRSLVLYGLWVLLGSVSATGSCRAASLCCTGRDSSCVVQRTVAGVIGHGIPSLATFADKPCYCDHACLKLGDCCEDFKQACGVVDCSVSPWEAWSSCSSHCGSGFRERRRRIIAPAQQGGKHCPALVQRRSCNERHKCDPDSADKAMLLPLSAEGNDSRQEPRYLLQYQVIKASKGCRKEMQYKALREGESVCVLCQSEQSSSYRCPGEGAPGAEGHFSAFTAPRCHGKWIRLPGDPPTSKESPTNVFCSSRQQFLFV